MKRIVYGLLALLLTVAVSLGLGWAVVVVLLWRYQETFVFPAPGGIDAAALDQSAAEVGAVPIRLTAEDGTPLYGWRREPDLGEDARCAVLYFHGNGETVAGSLPLSRWVARRGCAFVAVAYRGYPGSGGQPTEEGLAQDARAAWAYTTGELGISPDRVLVHGLSLGGAVAIRLASEVKPAALTVECSFTSLVDVAREAYPWAPVDTLLRPRFPSAERAAGIAAVTLVLHGDADVVVPVPHGRTLGQTFPMARYVEIPGGEHTELVMSDLQARAAYEALLDWVKAKDRPAAPAGWPE